MIVCPNCNHQNPDGAVQCEACYTPLPATTHCPSCGATVQTDASFCGQCGSNLQIKTASSSETVAPPAMASLPAINIPNLMPPEPLVEPDPLATGAQSSAYPDYPSAPLSVDPQPPLPTPAQGSSSQTQLQQQSVQLLQVQTNTAIEMPQNLSVIHIGKPNDRVYPDIDVSGFPNSDIVSRIHADIRVEGDSYYIEDVGSSNGTYINSTPLAPGNRHRLRSGDRISLGKGDLVTFIFQLS